MHHDNSGRHRNGQRQPSTRGVPRRPISRLAGATVAVTALAMLAGCGDDTTTATTPSTAVTSTAPTSSPNTATPVPTGTAATSDFCARSLQLETKLGAVVDFGPDVFADILPLFDSIVEAAPTQLDEAGTVVGQAFRAAAAGNFDSVQQPAFDAANATIMRYYVDGCHWTPMTVGLADFAFDGELPNRPGPYVFELHNEGDEAHLFVVGRLRDGVEGTAEAAFAAATEETIAASFAQVGNVFAAPGDTQFLATDLTPGRYVVYCPLPVGSTPDHDMDGDGPPHFTAGMLRYFDIPA